MPPEQEPPNIPMLKACCDYSWQASSKDEKETVILIHKNIEKEKIMVYGNFKTFSQANIQP